MSTITSPAPASTGTSTSTRLHRTFAAGGAAFATIVIAQNVLRGIGAPTQDASTADVLDYYSDHAGLAVVLGAMFVVGGVCLAGFVSELVRRVIRRGADVWATMGVIGAIAVTGLFTLVVAMESALVGAAGRDNPDLGTLDGLWLTHNAVFGVLSFALAIALLGLGRAAAVTGVAPRFFGWLAPVGAAGLCISAAATPVVADGTAMAAQAPGLAGFAIWLVFVITSSVRMVRSDS